MPWRLLLVGMLALGVAAPGAPVRSLPLAQAAAVVPADSPVGRQVTWLLDASHRLPLAATEIDQHFGPALLATLTPEQVNQGLAGLSGSTGLTLQRYQETVPGVAANVLMTSDTGAWQGGIAVNPGGLIDAINFLPYLPAPTTWAELDRRLTALAPRISFLAARLDERSGSCRPLHAIAPTVTRPLGSAFKLYVLAAVARAVAEHRATWDQTLPIREDWKSLPSGQLQSLPAGTSLSLQTYADYMISISDNTAADHLLHWVGRDSVQHQQVLLGMRHPELNRPFLTTREFFQLKLTHYPALVGQYLRLPQPARAGFLARAVDPLPLPSLTEAAGWTAPRAIDSAEWFASPADICRALAGLSRQAATASGQGVAEALSINDGGVWLDPAAWSSTWFKGGSEPGVLTLNYLARTSGGQAYVLSMMLSDPAAALPESSLIPEVLALVRGGLSLAAGSHLRDSVAATPAAGPAPPLAFGSAPTFGRSAAPAFGPVPAADPAAPADPAAAARIGTTAGLDGAARGFSAGRLQVLGMIAP